MSNIGHRTIKAVVASVVIIGLGAGYSYWALHRPLPMITACPGQASLSARAPAGTIAWPATGQAAVSVVDTNILETHGQQAPVPAASTAKLITALIIYDQEPLQPAPTGPTLTLGPNDVALYNNYVSGDGSVVKVVAGEQITEYQMFQAMLLPSANNIADSLAIWKFGSLSNYAVAANSWLQYHGLKDTHVGKDASGLDPSTTSTAGDLVQIGKLAMQNPVLAQIVGQATADLPVAGQVKNVNFLLGTHNIVGVKTGNSDQAGGVFVSAAKANVNGFWRTIITAYANAPNLFTAVAGSVPMIQSAQANFKPVTLVKAGAVVGQYCTAWGKQVSAVAGGTLAPAAWAGSTVTAKVSLKQISAAAHAGQTIGLAVTPDEEVPLKLATAPSQPSAWWRLTHP